MQKILLVILKFSPKDSAMSKIIKLRSQKNSLLILIALCCLSTTAFGAQTLPKLFLFMGGHPNLVPYQRILSNPCIEGVQIIYPWKNLEPKKGVYDFSIIENDLHFLNSIHKKLFVQLQDRSFQTNVINIPDYIRNEKIYHGGIAQKFDLTNYPRPIAEGWVAQTWNPSVRKRYQHLIKKLGAQFDGRIYGINLPETAVDFDPKNLPNGYSPDNYFYATLENMAVLRKAFPKTVVIQYVNFFPDEWNNDHKYMSRLFAYAFKYHIGLGGPDVAPYRPGQMKNSYQFFHQYKGKMNEISLAIQEPDLNYKNPNTNSYYTFFDFYSFAKNYLGATILFWTIQEPFFSKQLLPKLNDKYFACNV